MINVEAHAVNTLLSDGKDNTLKERYILLY